jgi:hypothetical protein
MAKFVNLSKGVKSFTRLALEFHINIGLIGKPLGVLQDFGTHVYINLLIIFHKGQIKLSKFIAVTAII